MALKDLLRYSTSTFCAGNGDFEGLEDQGWIAGTRRDPREGAKR